MINPPPSHVTVIRRNTDWFKLDLAALLRHRDLLKLLVWRDFLAKYKQTVLGPAWFILQPVLMSAIFTLIFSRVGRLPTDSLPPVLFYMAGLLGWNYFSQTANAVAPTFLHNAHIFSKVFFPRLIVPLALALSNLLALAIQILTFLAFFAYFKWATPLGATFGFSPALCIFPLLLLQTMALGVGVGLCFAALTAKYRDFIHLLPLLIQVWLYLTPIIYPASEVPKAWRWLLTLNPMASVVESLRLMLLGRGTLDAPGLLVSAALTVAILLVGLFLFHRVERTVVDIL
jgi:lipopolysaccharide transport system permease protein